jgi:hypothetical protein
VIEESFSAAVALEPRHPGCVRPCADPTAVSRSASPVALVQEGAGLPGAAQDALQLYSHSGSAPPPTTVRSAVRLLVMPRVIADLRSPGYDRL